MKSIEGEIMVFAVAAAFGGFSLIQKSWRQFLLRRRVEDLPGNLIRSAPQGIVELQGNALAIGTRMYPCLAGTLAVFGQYEVQYAVKNGFKTLYHGQVGDKFVLSDSTGAAIVRTPHTELEIEPTLYDWSDLTPTQQFNFKKYIFPHLKFDRSISIQNGLLFRTPKIGDGDWRVVERTLTLGSPAYVIGDFRTPSLPTQLDVCGPDRKPHRVEILGNVTHTALHSLVIADCHQDQLLARLGSWHPARMILGALLISSFVLLLTYKL